MIVPFRGRTPRIAASAFVAPTATVIGDVTIGEEASVWFGAVLRGDVGRIEIGARTSVQDNAVLHTTDRIATIIGDDVTIGHGAVLEGCTVERGALVGMNAVVLHDAVVGEEALIGAGSVVTDGTKIPARTLAAGSASRSRAWRRSGSRVPARPTCGCRAGIWKNSAPPRAARAGGHPKARCRASRGCRTTISC